MQEILVHASFYIFAAQFVLFAIPLAVSIGAVVYAASEVIKTIFFETDEEKKKYFRERYAKADALERARLKAEKGYSPDKTPGAPKLKPLNCPACGAGVPLREAEMKCPHCGNLFPVPKEYEQIRRLRADIAAKLGRATRHWNRASILTSRWLTALLLVVTFLHIAALPALAVFEQKEMLGSYEEVFADHLTLTTIAVFTWLFWIIILLFTAFYIEPRSRKNLPSLVEAENLGHAENAECSNCGGAVRYERQDLAAVCGYCGVETYRAKLAWEIRGMTNNVREKANFSLIDAAEAFREACWDLLGTPVFLVSIFITLPFFLIVVPNYLYNYFRDERPLLGIGLLALAAVFTAAIVFRNSLLGSIRGRS